MPMAPLRGSDSDSDIVEFTCRRGQKQRQNRTTTRTTATTTTTPSITTTPTPATAATTVAARKRRKKLGSSIRRQISPLSSSIAAHSTVSSVSLQSTLEEEDNNNNNHNNKKKSRVPVSARFIGAPLSLAQAQLAFPSHYLNNRFQQGGGICDRQNDQKLPLNEGQQDVWGRCVAHYLQAEVDGCAYKLGNCASLNTGDGPDFIGQILEFFEIDDGSSWFLAQRFFKAHDTAIGELEAKNHDIKRVFYSEVKDVSPLDCLVSKLKIVQVSPLNHFNKLNPKAIASCDYYYDMGYDHAYSRFYKLPFDSEANSSDLDVTDSNDVPIANGRSEKYSKNEARSGMELTKKEELCLLDLYSGCGGMSTGLCMGASLSGLNLVTKWAIDLNEHACKSLKFNHPETEVRNESAEDFLHLLKDWEQLCKKYCHKEDGDGQKANACSNTRSSGSAFQGDDGQLLVDIDEDEYAVEKIVGIRFMGSSSSSKKSGLQLKAHWKGYGLTQDSWEPIEGLRGFEGAVKKFVIDGNNARILPLPGDVDVVCGGPPCQGASGFNRFRNEDDPLADERNKQIVVYMDIVDYLKPRFVLMENVVDILKFAGGTLGRYALSRLVKMHYQAKLGLMVAGCYGLPQFRMRVFLWGASPLEKLPPYPLPTHDVIQKRGIPQEWERNVVAYNETQRSKLAKALTLGDALSDLPPVKNSEHRDEMPYDYKVTNTKFQRFIRLPKQVLIDPNTKPLCQKHSFVVYDHRPFELNADDYQRTCRIPKQKGANFRNLPGVLVRADNTVAIDPSKKRILLPSGKPLVPDYAITFVNGRSSKPFGRLWWDETVPTVVTRPEPHNQIILHPEQDRVLTIRENARLQGFPDYYKLFGPVKERYIQVGNAVAVPVSRALGYTLGLALQSLVSSGTVTKLPDNFPHSLMSSNQQLTTTDITF